VRVKPTFAVSCQRVESYAYIYFAFKLAVYLASYEQSFRNR